MRNPVFPFFVYLKFILMSYVPVEIKETKKKKIPCNYYENYTPPGRIKTTFNLFLTSDIDIVTLINKIKSNAIVLDNIHPLFIKMLLPKLLPYLKHIQYTI